MNLVHGFGEAFWNGLADGLGQAVSQAVYYPIGRGEDRVLQFAFHVVEPRLHLGRVRHTLDPPTL